MGQILPRDFYQQETLTVARELLGKLLVRELETGKQLVGKIVETEAYCGPEDLACHSSHGRTKRTEVMFGPAGHAYVYLIYGIYHCLNIVTEKPGAAVLIRGLEPLNCGPANSPTRRVGGPKPDGFFLGRTSSAEVSPVDERIAAGPGKLCRWLEITRELDGWDLARGKSLWVESGVEERFEIVAAPRVGVAYAGEWAAKPWRFCIKDNASVSKL